MKKIKLIVAIILTAIFLGLIIFCTYKLIEWKKDSNLTMDQVNKINDNVEIKEVADSDKTVIIDQDNLKKEDPYWDFIKVKLIDVNFTKLKQINKDTVSWIRVEGTNINYPVVQTSDNDFYLTRSFDKSKNNAGWVFLDYRNNPNQLNKNNIIYAHGRYDKTMFGSLKNILTSKWVNNSNNFIVKMSNDSENTLWQVFSVYRIKTTSDYLQIDFSSDLEFNEFANKLLARSNYNFNTTVNANDTILTLSTCYNNSDKVVLHAKLIKKEAR